MNCGYLFRSHTGTFLSGLLGLLGLLGFLALAGCDFGSPIKGGGGTEGEGLSGTLVDGGGSPVVGALVRAYPANDSASTAAFSLGRAGATEEVHRASATAVDSALTNAVGGFRLKRLSAGTYNLAASVRRGDTTLTVFIPGVVYAGGKQDLGIDTLRVSGSASLQVLTESDVLVGALCEIPGSPYRAVSDSSGICVFDELPQGTFVMRVSHNGYQATVSSGSAVNAGENSNCGSVTLLTNGLGVHVPADWALENVQGLSFYLPPDLLRTSESYGLDSWFVSYSSQTVRLEISAGTPSNLTPPAPLPPEYYEERIPWGSSRAAILITYKATSSASFGALLRMETTGSLDAYTGTHFSASCETREDCQRIAQMLRTVRPALTP
jgi:hypothetical protein